MKQILVDINKLSYTTASGNRYRVNVTGAAGDRVAFDITWTRAASPEDIHEYEAWIPGALGDQGIALTIEKSVYEQSAAKRQAICEDYIRTQKPRD